MFGPREPTPSSVLAARREVGLLPAKYWKRRGGRENDDTTLLFCDSGQNQNTTINLHASTHQSEYVIIWI